MRNGTSPKDKAEPGTLSRVKLEWKSIHQTPAAALSQALSKPFDATTFAWACQSDISSDSIELYIRHFEQGQTSNQINLCLDSYPVLFYAAERNDVNLVRVLIDYGADPDISTFSGMPILPFVVLNAQRKTVNALEVFKTLLARGASPSQLPKELWDNFENTPDDKLKLREPGITDNWRSSGIGWCDQAVYSMLASSLNITMRYLLKKASQIDKPHSRTKQFATAFGMSGLLEAPYHIIGQEYATKTIVSRITAHVLLYNTEPFPLTMVFAGPSGHGKTEMANTMGKLLGVESIVIDCTEMRHETDIFGPKRPYQGWEKGSPLNLFLAEQAGKRSVVFLDEFEKTTEEVRNALLLPFESGLYRDRRTGLGLDCSKTIWICATNLVDPLIASFFAKCLTNKSHDEQKRAPYQELDGHIRASFTERLGAPLTGRLGVIVPFFPFQPGEQAVIAYKEIQRLADKVRGPISVAKNQFIGHIDLRVKDDGKLCRYLAETGYQRVTGARSIAGFVRQHVAVELATVFQEDPRLVVDAMNEGPLLRYSVGLKEVGKAKSVGVVADGFTFVVGM